MEIIKKLENQIRIDSVTQSYLKSQFFKAAKEIGEPEFKYIQSKIYTKILSTRDDMEDWIAELSFWFTVLFEISDQYFSKAILLSEDTIQQIGAALFYFINPYDIIADKEENGYTDDYFVLYLCLSSMQKIELELIKEHARKKLEKN